MTDGTTNAIVVGERRWKEISGRRIGTSTLWSGFANGDPAASHLGNSFPLVVGNCLVRINQIPLISSGTGTGDAPYCCGGQNDATAIQDGGSFKLIPDPTWHGFASDHTGGCHFLLGDGSVRFLSENIDLTTYQRLALIKDGAVIGEF